MAYGIQVDFFLTCGTDEFKESELRLNKKKKKQFCELCWNFAKSCANVVSMAIRFSYFSNYKEAVLKSLFSHFMITFPLVLTQL